MQAKECQSFIIERMSVTPPQVTIAKAIILNACKAITYSTELIDAVVKANDAAIPKPVAIYDGADAVSQLKAVCDYLSWSFAAIEAIWSLIYNGYLIQVSGDLQSFNPTIQWTTVQPGSGGASGGWSFDEFMMSFPIRVRQALSMAGSNDHFLSEPDLYLNELGIKNMHTDVAAAFQEAVKCFRSELFTATLAMLGKASEGAWLELGQALLSYAPADKQSIFAKHWAVLDDPRTGVLKKIDSVIKIFEKQDIFGPVWASCSIRPKELREVATWSDAVRDSRNTIHFGVTPATPNTYEKVAALLIGIVPNVRTLYRLKETADQGHT